MTRRRLFDPLDIGACRAAVTRRDLLSLVVIALVVACVPVLFFLAGVEEGR